MATWLHFSSQLILIIILLMIDGNKFRSSQSAIVEHLPGYSGPLPFTLETGYVGVGEKEEVQLFYYFIKSENNPENDPLVLWFTGGPGCSALSGILYEIGPFTIDYANSDAKIPSLIPNKYSWTKLANIIFFDQPVGTGFSYANTSEGYFITDTLAAAYNYDFLRKWLMNHPNYLKNPLYISGDSYSGIMVPLVIDLVHNGIELGSVPKINFKGYTLGNPGTDAYIDENGKYKYAHQMGLISNGLYKSAKETCRGNYVNVDPSNILCHSALERISQCLEYIRKDMILDPVCLDNSSHTLPRHLLSYKELLNNSIATAFSRKSWCRSDNYVFSATWANNKIVQKALHVREGTILEWTRCNDSIQNRDAYIREVPSTISYHKKFSRKSCRALIYSGDHDLLITRTSTEEWIESLNIPIQSDWRPWYVKGQVAGYTMTYKHNAYELTYATVKGAGHTAPEYKPMECFAMMRNWLDLSPLPNYNLENDGASNRPVQEVITHSN